MARAILELIGDPASLLRAVKKTDSAIAGLDKDVKQLGITAEQSARAQIQAAQRRDARLRQEVAAYRQLASAAKRGSQEQVAAARLAERAQERLTRSILATEREQKRAARRGSFGNEFRGGLAGSGVLAGTGRALAFGSLGFLGGFTAASAFRDVVEQASTIQEETEKTTELFGESAREVQRWSRTLASSFGVSEGEALKSAGVFGNMFRSLHFGEVDAAKMSQRLVELAADMASFNNASPEETLQALQSGLAGQVRPLRRFGVFLSQDKIKQEALTSGIAKNTAHLTAAQKVQAAYNIILEQTKIQQGDVARNTESLSVAESKLRAQLANNEAKIGRALLPALVKLTNAIAKGIPIVTAMITPLLKLADAGIKVADAFKEAHKYLKYLVPEELLATKAFNVIKGLGDHGGKSASPLTGPVGTPRSGDAARPPGLTGPVTPKPRASLSYQISLAQLALAQAEQTATKRDDRARLVRLRALERQKLAQTKSLRDQLTLTDQINALTAQIASIDTENAAKRKAAADAQLKAAQKQLHADQAELKALNVREHALKERIKGIQEAFKNAVDAARQGIGDLFGGPVLNFSEEQRKAALGIPNTAADPRALTRDLRAQVQAEAKRQKDIETIRRRLGLKRNAELIKELQANTGDATQVAALAGAPTSLLRSFSQQFGKRERLALNIARAQMHVQLVRLHADRIALGHIRQQTVKVEIEIKGDKDRVKVKQSAAQRRGPVPGRS